MAFTQKAINVTFALGTGSFGLSGTNTVTVSGCRVVAQILAAGGPTMGHLDLKVWGLPLNVMNELSAPYRQSMLERNNTVTVEAGDNVSGMAAVFSGTIVEGWANASAEPDVYLQVTALEGALQAAIPAPPTSYSASADAATILSGLATLAKLQFENSGVSVQLSTPYFPGSIRDQIKACAEHANINWIIERNTLAIWPKGAARNASIPLVSPDNMIGYPAFTSTGIAVRTLFLPTLAFGQSVKVQSELQVACGTWYVTGISHSLASETPNGDWFTSFQGAPLSNRNVIP